MKKISPANFAKKIGVSRARVSQLMKGILKSAIIRVPGKSRVLLDELKAAALYKAYSDPAKKRTEIIDSEYFEARRQRLEIEAKLQKHKYEEKLKKYISRSELKVQAAKAIEVIEAHRGELAPAIIKALKNETDKNKALEKFNLETNRFLKGLQDDLSKLDE